MQVKTLLLRFLFVVLLIPAVTAVLQYGLSVQYTFRTKAAFSGPFWYNPYAACDSSGWLKANFHVHSNSWGPFTNGRKSNPEKIDSIYRLLGYDVPCISDYQSINSIFSVKKGYLPVYEHGYGMGKNHQQVINATSVSWKDYLLPQTMSNRQEVIDALTRDTGCVVVANHPEFSLFAHPSDFTVLGGYHCMEVLSRLRQSFASWDSALSSGYPAWITANDDGHDISNPTEAGKCLTLLRANHHTKNIVQALRKGKTIGVVMPDEGGDNPLKRKEMLLHLPLLTRSEIRGDTLWVSFNKTAAVIRFTGQHGKEKFIQANTKIAGYKLKNTDTYIRTTAVFGDGIMLCLNPVIRSHTAGFTRPVNNADTAGTFLLRTLTLSGFIVLVFLFYFRRKHVRRTKSNRYSAGL